MLKCSMEENQISKREELLKRFKASKERKKKVVSKMETMLRNSYRERTGEEPLYINVW